MITDGPAPPVDRRRSGRMCLEYGDPRTRRTGVSSSRAVRSPCCRARQKSTGGVRRACRRALRADPAGGRRRVPGEWAGGARYVCWAHGEEVMASVRRGRWSGRRARRRRRRAVFANSRNTATVLGGSSTFPADRIEVVYPGVDAGRFRPACRRRALLRARLAAPDEIVLLCVGRLQRRKGHDLVLQALARAGRAAPVAVRDPSATARSASLERTGRGAGESPTESRSPVRCRQAICRRILPPRMSLSTRIGLTAATSRGSGLWFSRRRPGLPVIAGSTGGVPEAVADGETGLLVSGTDADELQARSDVSSAIPISGGIWCRGSGPRAPRVLLGARGSPGQRGSPAGAG